MSDDDQQSSHKRRRLEASGEDEDSARPQVDVDVLSDDEDEPTGVTLERFGGQLPRQPDGCASSAMDAPEPADSSPARSYASP